MSDFADPATPAAEFKRAHPRPVHFREADYAGNKAEIDISAAAAGYRLAGQHHKTREAVFTTKAA